MIKYMVVIEKGARPVVVELDLVLRVPAGIVTDQHGDGQPGAAGEPISVEGIFPPGDYDVVLQPRQVSDAEYMLSLERLPRFSCPADCEPNGMGEIYRAAPLPLDLVLEGRAGEWRDRDDYELPVFEAPTELVMRSAAPVAGLSIGRDARSRDYLQYDMALGGYRTTSLVYDLDTTKARTLFYP